MDDLLSLSAFESRARETLPRMAFDYFAGAADDRVTLRENRAAFERLALRYRVLAKVGQRDTRQQVLGHDLSFPVCVAPMAFQRLAHDEGEAAAARATAEAGTVYINSTLSTVAVETVCAAAPGRVWFQLYVYKDRAATEALVRRAEAAGCTALVLTVDAPVLGKREQDVHNGFHLPDGLGAENLHGAGYAALDAVESDSGLSAYVASLLDPNLGWEDVAWLKSITTLPLLIKGVVRGDDAALAIEHGAAGVVVSNHGGRQLDTAPATIRVLPEVVQAVANRGAVLLDGGIRRGTDVIKALALGADAVLLGRPILWGLTVNGQAGAARVLELLRTEFDQALALCGATKVSDLKDDLILL